MSSLNCDRPSHRDRGRLGVVRAAGAFTPDAVLRCRAASYGSAPLGTATHYLRCERTLKHIQPILSIIKYIPFVRNVMQTSGI